MTYRGPVKKNDSPSKVLLSNSAAPKTTRSRNASTKEVKQKNFFTFPRMRRQKSPLLNKPLQAPVVQRLNNAIHRINHYPADSVVCFVNTYPLDSDLSGGQRYPAFEQPGPGQ